MGIGTRHMRPPGRTYPLEGMPRWLCVCQARKSSTAACRCHCLCRNSSCTCPLCVLILRVPSVPQLILRVPQLNLRVPSVRAEASGDTAAVKGLALHSPQPAPPQKEASSLDASTHTLKVRARTPIQ